MKSVLVSAIQWNGLFWRHKGNWKNSPISAVTHGKTVAIWWVGWLRSQGAVTLKKKKEKWTGGGDCPHGRSCSAATVSILSSFACGVWLSDNLMSSAGLTNKLLREGVYDLLFNELCKLLEVWVDSAWEKKCWTSNSLWVQALKKLINRTERRYSFHALLSNVSW